MIEEFENTGRTLSKEAMAARYEELYDQEIAQLQSVHVSESDWMTGGAIKGLNDIAKRRVVGAWQVQDYSDFAESTKNTWRILPLGGDKIATEVEFSIPLGKVTAYGFIDQIRQYMDGSLEMADLKSGTGDPGSSIQLGVYAQAALVNLGVLPSRGVFIKAGRPATEKVAAKPTKDMPHQLGMWTVEKLTQIFEDMDRAEKAGIYLPNAQTGCERVCSVAPYCTIKGNPAQSAQFDTIRLRTNAPKVAA